MGEQVREKYEHRWTGQRYYAERLSIREDREETVVDRIEPIFNRGLSKRLPALRRIW